MTRFLSPLRGNEFYSPSDEAISARISGDSYARIRIDAGGRLTWGDGTNSGDVKLYRAQSNAIVTDGVFSASLGLITAVTEEPPNMYYPDGAILVDRSTNSLYFRVNNTWLASSSGAGGVVTISAEAPGDPESGDLWFDSDTDILSVYNGSSWIGVSGSLDLDGLDDVTISSPQDGQILKYSSASAIWYNEYEAIQNIDGGLASSIYGGIVALSGGGANG